MFTTDTQGPVRVTFPMLVFDGRNETEIRMDGNAVRLALDGKAVKFTVIEPAGATLKRTGEKLTHRNGLVEAAHAEVAGPRIVYRVEGAPE